MKNRILPEFQDFLLSRSLVPEKNVSFFACWVSKFLAFSNRNEDLGPDLRVKSFINHLKSQTKIADWQIRQADDALCYTPFNERSEYQGDTEFTGSQAC